MRRGRPFDKRGCAIAAALLLLLAVILLGIGLAIPTKTPGDIYRPPSTTPSPTSVAGANTVTA